MSDQSKPLLINLTPVSTGGGLQNALSLIRSLQKQDAVVICIKGSRIAQECERESIAYDEVSNRACFEGGQAVLRFGKNRTCFTQFGAPPLCSLGNWLNVSGVAYSNLFYPEIDFWGHLPPIQKAIRQIKDVARKKGILRADAWIFETEVLANRACEMGFPQDRVFHVPMAVSRVVSEASLNLVNRTKRRENEKRILYLGAAHPNKRQHLLVNLASELERISSPVKFVTTMSETSTYAKSVISDFRKSGFEAYLENIGPVDPSSVAALIESADAMILLSALESFSNNFVEAWSMQKPLFVTDADWSRSSCRDGALYLDVSNMESCALRMSELLNDAGRIESLTEKGESVFATYPNASGKTQAYLEVVEKVRSLGKCPSKAKSLIRL